jgi:hypothetical protein
VCRAAGAAGAAFVAAGGTVAVCARVAGRATLRARWDCTAAQVSHQRDLIARETKPEAKLCTIEAGRLCATGWTNGVVFGPASGVGKQVGGFAGGFHPLSGCGSLLALVFWQP